MTDHADLLRRDSEPADIQAGRLRVIANWFAGQNLVEPAAHLMCAADSLTALVGELAQARSAYQTILADRLTVKEQTLVADVERMIDETSVLEAERDRLAGEVESLKIDNQTLRDLLAVAEERNEL